MEILASVSQAYWDPDRGQWHLFSPKPPGYTETTLPRSLVPVSDAMARVLSLIRPGRRIVERLVDSAEARTDAVHLRAGFMGAMQM